MPSSQARIDANRRNSARSTGPRTARGRERSKYNALKHGMRARTDVLPTEDPAEFEERLAEILRDAAPRNVFEYLLARQIARATWQQDRAVRVQTARISRLIEEAARREQEAIITLGKNLFADSRGPTVLYGCDGFHHVGCRTSYSGVIDDPNDPDRIIRTLERSVLGCQWLLDGWSELRALLEQGKCWQSHHKLRAVRLLGKQPLSALDYREVSEIFVGCWAIDPARPSAYAELKSELGPEEYRAYLKRVRAHWTDMMNAGDSAGARCVLMSIVDRAIEQVKARAAVAAELAEQNAERDADCLSFDDSPEGHKLRGYEATSGRSMERAINGFLKVRRAGERGELEPQGISPDEDDHPPPHEADSTSGEVDEQATESDPQSGSSVQCSVFSVQLDVAQPAAEQFVCSDFGGRASCPSVTIGGGGLAPAAGFQCSVFSVQLDVAQTAAAPQSGSGVQCSVGCGSA
jgi:hypothetical protein